MGDFDSEMYNTANLMYNEMQAMHEVLKDLNRNVASLVQEIKDIRADQMKR